MADIHTVYLCPVNIVENSFLGPTRLYNAEINIWCLDNQDQDYLTFELCKILISIDDEGHCTYEGTEETYLRTEQAKELKIYNNDFYIKKLIFGLHYI